MLTQLLAALVSLVVVIFFGSIAINAVWNIYQSIRSWLEENHER